MSIVNSNLPPVKEIDKRRSVPSLYKKQENTILRPEEVNMPLVNFGSVLGFAEEIEKQHLDFLSQASVNPDCDKHSALFESLAKSAKKRVVEVQRVRRENVSEMVLAAIEGFQRDAYLVTVEDGATLTLDIIAAKAEALSERSLRYYEKAAEKLQGQADVARAMKGLVKKHKKDRQKLEVLNS